MTEPTNNLPPLLQALAREYKPDPTIAVPPLLAELDPAQFGQWLQHPVTKLVIGQYFPDLQRFIERETMMMWRSGNLVLNEELRRAGLIMALEWFGRISLETMRLFYGEVGSGVKEDGSQRRD